MRTPRPQCPATGHGPAPHRSAVLVFAALIAALLAAVSCTSPGTSGESAEVPEPAPEAVDNVAAEEEERTETRGADAVREAREAEAVREAEVREAEEAQVHARALALDALLTELGWRRSGAASAEAFVVSPDGTQTVAGRYRQESREVTVAVFVYPNERFASPHAVDLRERVRLVPGAREGGLHLGRLVVHARGQDGESTRELLEALSGELSVPLIEAR